MSQRAFAIVCVFFAVSCSGLNLELKLQNDPQCKFKGKQCSSDLKSIIYCSAKNGNSYVVTSCLEPTLCRLNNKGEYECARDGLDFPEIDEKDIVFTCQGEGGYPDAYRCGVGYLCSSAGTFPDMICKCPKGQALTFVPNFGCTGDKEMIDDCSCPYKDRCRGGWLPGDFGVSCHSGYFYVCRGDGKGSIRPEVHKCPNGQVFIDGKCQSFESFSTKSSSLSDNIPECTTYYPPCLPGSDVKCSKVGELLPHKVERCYYHCGADLKPIVRDCGKGSYFGSQNGEWGCFYKKN